MLNNPDPSVIKCPKCNRIIYLESMKYKGEAVIIEIRDRNKVLLEEFILPLNDPAQSKRKFSEIGHKYDLIEFKKESKDTSWLDLNNDLFK